MDIHSSIVHSSPNNPNVSADEWINKMWYMQIISSHKKKLSTGVYDNINNLEHKRLHAI